jgi:hypothetical protein
MEIWLSLVFLAITVMIARALNDSPQAILVWTAVVLMAGGAVLMSSFYNPFSFTGAVGLATAYAMFHYERSRKKRLDEEKRIANGDMHIQNYGPVGS